MKILLISNLYPPEARGGAEMIARDIAQEAVRSGHDITLLSTTSKNSSSDMVWVEVVNGVTVKRYAPNLPYYILDDAKQSLGARIIWHFRDLVGSRKTSHFIKEVIKDVSPDVIITLNLRGMEIGSVVRVIRKSRITWIHQLHDIQLLVPSGLEWFGPKKRIGLRWFWQSSLVRVFYTFFIGYIMSSPDFVVSPSVFMIGAHRNAGLFAKSEFRTLINPVDFKFAGKNSVPVLLDRAKLATNQEKLWIKTRLLYVGQLEPHKGVHDVLEALKHAGEHEIVFDVVGHGSAKADLMNKVLELPSSVTVKFHGRVDHETVFEFMSKSHALILPSVVTENCPGVILEARSMNLPVIASNVGGVAEFIDSSGLFSPANPREIMDKIHLVARCGVKSLGSAGLLSINEYVKRLLDY